MRKSELLAIKKREYERGLADAKLTISERDIQGWADKARGWVLTGGLWEHIGTTMKKMLTEIGVTIYPSIYRGRQEE